MPQLQGFRISLRCRIEYSGQSYGRQDSGEDSLSEAVPAQSAGDFTEMPVASYLGDVFSAVWMHRLPEKNSVPPLVIVPDGTIDLQWINGAFRIAGPDREPKTEHLQDTGMVVGFRFQPGAAAAWLGMPATEIAGQRLALDDLWGRKARRMNGGVGSPEALGLVASLQAAIARAMPETPLTDQTMRAAYKLIEAGPPSGAPLIPWLGRALAMSERTLRRRFDESFGYGPKTLDRILRYQRYLDLKRRSHGSPAMLAVEAGYADQAHLVRESRRLTCRTPAEFERLVGFGRS